MELFGGTYEDAKPFERCKLPWPAFFQMHWTCCLLFSCYLVAWKNNPLRWTSILILSNTENGWTHQFPTTLGVTWVGWPWGPPLPDSIPRGMGHLEWWTTFVEWHLPMVMVIPTWWLSCRTVFPPVFFPWSFGGKRKLDMYTPWN